MDIRKLGCACFVFAFFSFTFAQDERKLPENMTVRTHAYGHFESGQIVHGNIKNEDLSTNGNKYDIAHVWTEDAVVAIGVEALYKERLKLAFGISSKLYFSYPQFLKHDGYTKNMRQDFGFDDVYAQYTAGGEQSPMTIMGRVGYFTYKYNPDVRNLGEYLFRTGTYPAFIDNGFDFPARRLLGFQGQLDLFHSFRTDLFFISQTISPAMNWSVAALADYDLLGKKFLTIGVGVNFSHLFDVYNDQSFPADGGNPTQSKSDINSQYIKEITPAGDTIKEYYTFKGTKIMARISLDPKILIPFSGFGQNDLRVYAEACVVGVKSYPDSGFMSGSPVLSLVAPSYNKINEKTPIVIGFNFPMFKILDVLNFECEYFGAKYYNDASFTINKGSAPLPNNVTAMITDPNSPRKSDIKWSAYAKRSFFDGHFSIIGQVASDHMRLGCAAYNYEYWNDLLVTKDDWWWVLKTTWSF